MSDSRLGPLIGTGRTAEIFAWGNNQVVKLLLEGFERYAEKEMLATQAAFDAGLPVPAVGELVEIEGRRGIVLERIDGPSMMDIIQERPWRIARMARLWGELHVQIHSHEAEALPSLRGRLESRIRDGTGLPPPMLDGVLDALDILPDGDTVCHGDFHPDNIIMSPRGPVIIDWVDASMGQAVADIARSWLLARFAVLPVRIGTVQRWLITAMRAWSWSTYLKRYRELRPFLDKELEDWKLVIAAARLEEGIPEEREPLVAFIEAVLRGYRPSVSTG